MHSLTCDNTAVRELNGTAVCIDVCVIHTGVMWYDTVMTSTMLSNISAIYYYPILDDMDVGVHVMRDDMG